MLRNVLSQITFRTTSMTLMQFICDLYRPKQANALSLQLTAPQSPLSNIGHVIAIPNYT